MGLVSYLVKKGVQRATIKTIGRTATDVIVAKNKAETERINAQTRQINAEIARINANGGDINFIKKENVIRIKPPHSSEKYRGTSALNAVKELLGAGFVDITLKPVKSLGERSKKYGLINSISINGNSDFLGVKKISPFSKIVINYLDFKKGVSSEVYANIERITPGTIHCVEDLATPANGIKKTETIKKAEGLEREYEEQASQQCPVKYCAYCGEKVTKERAKFCSACGEEL